MRSLTVEQIADYTELTCTNLMIKLKILLKKLDQNQILQFFANREQVDNIKKPFSKNAFSFEAVKVNYNKYHCRIKKK